LTVQILKNTTSIKDINENDPEITPLLRNFGIQGRVNASDVDHTPTLIEIYRTLTNFGLSKNEVNVYLFLLKTGVHKASKISERLGITRTEIYKILKSLEAQGIVIRLVEKPFRYLAISLEDLFNIYIQKEYNHVRSIEDQKETLIQKWSLVKQRTNKPEIKSMVFQVLEGTSHIYIKIKELLDNCNSSFDMALSSDVLLWLYNTPFFELIEKRNRRKASAVDVRLVTKHSDISEFVLSNVNTDTFDFAFNPRLNIPGFLISDEGEIILLIRNGVDDLFAMWTNYDSLVGSNQLLFTYFWDRK